MVPERDDQKRTVLTRALTPAATERMNRRKQFGAAVAYRPSSCMTKPH